MGDDDGLLDEARAVFGAHADSTVTTEPIPHAAIASATAGLVRVRCGERSAVVKVLAHRPGGHDHWQAGAELDHWYYWRQEADAYASGLLAGLTGGLRAPRCYLVAERGDGSIALWLEDVDGAPASTWSLERYGLAARHLGEAQGPFAVGRRLPEHAWLSRGWLRTYLAQREIDLGLLQDATIWRHPLVAPWFPRPPIDELVAMADDRERFLRILAQLPPTLAHLDLHPANLFDDAGTTVLIDWAFVGLGALGEDAGNLVPDAVLDFHVPPERIDDLHSAVVEGYEAGLRAAGWEGPSTLVRLGMAATVAAKYAWIAPALLRTAAERREQLNRRPTEEAVAAWATTVRYLVDQAQEARDLAVREFSGQS